MKIAIPFLKVPYFTTIFLLILSGTGWYPEWDIAVLLLIIIFFSGFYLAARAIYIKKYFWAWVMGGVGLFFNPILRVVDPYDIDWSIWAFFLVAIYIFAGISLRVSYSIRGKASLFLRSNIKKVLCMCAILLISFFAVTTLFVMQRNFTKPKALTDKEMMSYEGSGLVQEPPPVLTDEEMFAEGPRDGKWPTAKKQ